jgi:hypothetical protein
MQVLKKNKFARIVERHKSRESNVEGKSCNYVKKHLGGMSRKMNGFGFNHWPDRLFLLGGCPELWVEFKRPGKEPTDAQWKVIRDLRAQGREVWVEDSAKVFISKVSAWYVTVRARAGLSTPTPVAMKRRRR